MLPVVPKNLLNYLCAPIPYIIGVVSDYKNELRKLPLCDTVLIDLDQSKIEFYNIQTFFPTLCYQIPVLNPETSKLLTFNKSIPLPYKSTLFTLYSSIENVLHLFQYSKR